MKTNFSYLKVSAVVLVFPFALLSFIIATLGYASDMGYANLLERACCGLAAAVYLLYFIPNRVIAQNRHITEALAKPLAISAYGGHREGFWKEKMPV